MVIQNQPFVDMCLKVKSFLTKKILYSLMD